MLHTRYLNMNKPELSDPADITELNTNFDILDGVIGDATSRVSNTPFTVNTASVDSNGIENLLYTDTTSGTVDVSFEQPILSSNGTVDGTSFAVFCDTISDIYKAFDNKADTYITISNSANIIVYNPTEIKLEKLSFTAKNDKTISVTLYAKDSVETELFSFTVALSADRESVVTLPNNLSKYKKYQLSIVGEAIQLAEIKIGAVVSKSVASNQLIKFRGGITATNTLHTFILDSIAPKDTVGLNGTYTVCVDELGTVELLGTVYAQKTEPTTSDKTIWLKTFEPLQAFVRKNNAWVKYNGIPLGSVTINSGVISSLSTYSYNQNAYNINTYTIATNVRYGVLRSTSVDDELNNLCEDASITPTSLYNLNDYRKKSTAYSVGEMVKCQYHAEYMLKCVQSGTTSNTVLNTKTVTAEQEITDGSVKWKVFKLMLDEGVPQVGEVVYALYSTDGKLSGFKTEARAIVDGTNLYRRITGYTLTSSSSKEYTEDLPASTEALASYETFGSSTLDPSIYRGSYKEAVFSNPFPQGNYLMIKQCAEIDRQEESGDLRPFCNLTVGIFMKV